MEETVRDHLLGTLEDEFETFKSKLSEIQLQGGSGNIPWSTLEVADPRDLTEELLRGSKDDDGVEVTRKVLRAINQQDQAERLTKTTGGGGSNPDQEPETHQDPEMVGEELLKERRRALQDLLAKLKMEQHRSTKLGLRDLQEINPQSLKDWTPQALGDLPWHFLRKVMALNGTARNTSFWQRATGDQASSEENGGQGGGGNVLHHSNSNARASLHPLDVLCAVLLCSDSFLQQEILSRMSMCQFALPLLLPALDTRKGTLMLWAMRDIVRKWRPHSLAESRGFREESLVRTKMPTISFVRLGSCSFSKSKLLNEVLSPSQQHHDFFIHRDMESGNVPREIADGLVEISWYFPGGRENSDLFPEPIAVTNLRGDIESHWLQFSFLTEISSAVFIVTESISEREYALLSSLQGSATKYYFILSAQAEQCSETLGFLNKLAPVLKLNKLNVLEKSNSTNETEFVENLQHTIRSIMNSSNKRVNMEAVATAAHELGVLVDEDCEECQSGSKWAREITVNMRDVANCKAEMLTLQGDLWNTLTKVEKELCRMKEQGTVPPEDYKMQLKEKLSELHAQQNNCELNDGLIKFINGLEQLTAVEKHHFLKWLKYTLDHIAKDEHSRLQVQYNALAGDPQKLEELDELISAGSLGVEHFLRELGQLYEAEHAMVKEAMATGDKYTVIRTKRKELIGIIQRDPESVLDELLAQSVITEEEYDSMNQLQDKAARIRKLLIYIQKRGESSCRDFLECLEILFPGTNRLLQPSEYDFFNPERDSRTLRDPEPRERDFFNPEHHTDLKEEDGFNPEQESETQRDPEPEEKDGFNAEPDPQLEEEDGSNPEKESDIELDPETGGSDLEQESETQRDQEPEEEDGSNPEPDQEPEVEDGSNPEQELETEPDPEPEGSNSEQESDTQ
ncbi:sulfurase [Platysternon megacephalum]|uniref:Sulfurase n=1 Tax=Platysternon megacephalum TaxID=55544 RepID=A0A4D9DPB8_9SAUR|nr:sulfurase [Platysternon megacephalum]